MSAQNKKSQFDFPKIQKIIRKKHLDFIEVVGSMPYKITADHELLKARILTKLSRILECFVNENIVDIFLPCQELTYFGFHITKKGYGKSIFIWTDGKDILFIDSNLLIRHGALGQLREVLHVSDIDTYDWEEFSVRLLDYIHGTIYERKESIEAKIFKG